MNTPGGNRYGWGVGGVPMPRNMRKPSATGLANQGFFAAFFRIVFQDFPWLRGAGIFFACVSVITLVAVSSGKIREPEPPRPVDVTTIILQETKVAKPKPPEKKNAPIKKERHTPLPKPKPRKHTPKPAAVVVKKTDRTDTRLPDEPVVARRKYVAKKMGDPVPRANPENFPLPDRPEISAKMSASSANPGQRYYALNSPNRKTAPPRVASDSGPLRLNGVSDAFAAPVLSDKRYSGKKLTGNVPVSDTNEPIFSGNKASLDTDDPPGMEIGFHAGSPNRAGGGPRSVAAGTGTLGNPLSGVPDGDLSGLVSLDDLGVCIDPKEEFALRSELAAKLDKPGRCQSRELSFVFRYVETGYTIHLDVHNPKKLRLGDRCAVLRKAAECVDNR